MKRRRFLQSGAMAAAFGLAGWGTRSRAGTPARVVIVGAGFAGATCARHVRRLNPDLRVILIDPDDRYVTCPMSNEVIGGSRTLESITVSRAGLRRAGVEVLRGRVVRIDARRRLVRLESGQALGYDRLVVAPGIRLLWDRPQGYDAAATQRMPHAWKAGPQTALLRAQVRAMADGGVVAISVPSGLMRCPPGPYERASLIAHYLRAHKPRSKVLIFDANNHFPKQDVFAAAWRDLYPGMIDWIPPNEGGLVERVDPARLMLYTDRGTHRVAVANIIAPQAPNRIAADAGLASGHGWCPVDRTSFASSTLPDVHVIGDACIADAMPKSASAASSQAAQCALAIVAALAGVPVPMPALDSVCYSVVAPSSAIAFPAVFSLREGRIVRDETPHTGPATPAFGARQARDAQAWYRRILAQAFAA